MKREILLFSLKKNKKRGQTTRHVLQDYSGDLKLEKEAEKTVYDAVIVGVDAALIGRSIPVSDYFEGFFIIEFFKRRAVFIVAFGAYNFNWNQQAIGNS